MHTHRNPVSTSMIIAQWCCILVLTCNVYCQSLNTALPGCVMIGSLCNSPSLINNHLANKVNPTLTMPPACEFPPGHHAELGLQFVLVLLRYTRIRLATGSVSTYIVSQCVKNNEMNALLIERHSLRRSPQDCTKPEQTPLDCQTAYINILPKPCHIMHAAKHQQADHKTSLNTILKITSCKLSQ